MDTTKMNSSPILGMSANVTGGTKLKTVNSPVSYNNCSPHGPLNTNNNGIVSSFGGFNQDLKLDDGKLAKNGGNAALIDSSVHNSDIKEPTMVTTSAPAGLTASHRSSVGNVKNSKKDPLKMTIIKNPQTEPRVLNNNCIPSPNGVKGNTNPYQREIPAPKNSTLHRSYSAMGRETNNMMFTQRRNTVDAGGMHSPTSHNITNKLGDKLRQSPRNSEFSVNDHHRTSDLDSPYPSPLSNEPVGNVNSLRGKTKTFPHENVSKNVANNHISRTSSCNSVSDSSLTSNDTPDENNRATTVHTTSETITNPSYLPPLSESNNELSIENTLIASPNTYDSAIVDTLQDIAEESTRNNELEHNQVSFDDVENFQFSESVNGAGDISPEDLNLSAEDIQKTLDSVSAESGLPDLNSITNGSTSFDDRLLGQDNNLNNFTNLSPSSALNTTSSNTSVVTTAVSSTTQVIASTTSSQPSLPTLSSPSQNTSNPSSTFNNRENFITSFPSTSSHSQLEEILGSHDTEKLKNMSRPVGTTQFHPTSTPTSFNTSTTTNPYTSDAPNGHHPPTEMPPNRRFVPPNQPGYVPRHMMRMPNTGFPSSAGPNQNIGFEGNNIPPGFMEPNMGPRHGIHFEQVPSSPHHMPPYNMMSPTQQSPWQRPGSVGSMMSPHAPIIEGSKSPRGGNYPLRQQQERDPMSRLQKTVASIPESFMVNDFGSMTKNNNNNMGPPNMGDFPMMSPTGRSMLPPPSPLTDKRTMSSDGPMGSGGKTKGNKRERGLSVESKDGDKKGKESGPKPKRRKSKSKDENKKADAKLRLNSSIDHQANPYMYIFNTEDVNQAATMVMQKKSPSIITYHNKFKGNCSLIPSKPLPNTMNNNGNKLDGKGQFLGGISSLQMPKSEPNNQASPRGLKVEDPKSLDMFIKQENLNSAQNPTISTSPNTSTNIKNENQPAQSLSDEKLRHRNEALSKISQIKQRFCHGGPSGPSSNPSSSANPAFSMNPQVRPNNTYAMTNHLEKVKQELNNPVSGKDDNQWFKLVQAYNEKKKRMRTQVRPGTNPDNIAMDPDLPPPPYNGPSRWMGPGHPIREPNMIPGPDTMIPNQRFPPHMNIRGPIRLPHGDPHFPPGYMQSRFPRGYMVPPGGSRMHMYPGSGPQTGQMMGPGIPRTPRLPPQHPMSGHPNEAYPFSEKLKEQASLYRGEGMHNPQNPPMGFEINNPGDPNMGPRMNSPEWNYGNPNMPSHPNNRLSHMPETISPSHNPMSGPPGGMMMSSGGPNQPIDPNLDNRLTPGMEIRMNNPYMSNFPNKHPLPNYPENSMGPPMSQQDLRPPMGEINHGMLMMDAMARRGESRPPDINIPRSPLGFSGRHPTPTSLPPNNNPNMINPNHFNMDILPQVSPHHNPRSPMMTNSPQMMKSPMVGQFMGPMGHNNMENMGPTSAGAQPNDWGQLPQSLPPQRAPSSGGMMSGQHPQSSVLSTMINRVNNIPLPLQSPLYQDAVKDTASPPPLSHINNGPMMQEPPPLSHNPMEPMPMGTNMGINRNPSMMNHHPVGPPSYDPPINAQRPRMMGPMMVEGYPVDFRPPSHPGGMCMSPTMQGGQNMMPPQGNMMDMQGPPSGYVPNLPPGHPGNQPNSGPPSGQMNPGGQNNNRGGLLEFDLTGMIPSEKPSQTLSYFPAGNNNQEKLDPGLNMRSSPSMPPTRFPMSQGQQRPMAPGGQQRPMTPGGNNFNNHSMRPPSSFMGGGNPPSYHSNEEYMSPSWENSRPQMMPSNNQMHPNFPLNRPLM